MGLAQSIVVVNQFTVKDSAGSGSRGSTPGKYLTRYMAREDANEAVRVTGSVSRFVTDYMAREGAGETVDDTYTLLVKEAVASDAQDTDKFTGLAFGNGKLSLSKKELFEQAHEVQELFDNGHTVMKTVVSFDHQYLVDNGVVDDSVTIRDAGDYRGQIDQLKLRTAIMAGVERMGRMYYDDLVYTAVIQVDTKHVHAHLVMVDKGTGNRHENGQQRGKIPSKAITQLRRGIDLELDDLQKVRSLASTIGIERKNAAMDMRKKTYQHLLADDRVQLIVQALPENTALWRANSRAKSMAHANYLTYKLVEEQLRHNQATVSALDDIRQYADERKKREGLSTKETEKLYDTGRRKLFAAAVNGVYHVLKSCVKQKRQSRRLSQNTQALTTVLNKATAYQQRLEHHKSLAKDYRLMHERWQAAYDAGLASDSSAVMGDFYHSEATYHEMAASKYQHYMLLFNDEEEALSKWRDIESYGHKLIGLKAMRGDKSLPKLKSSQEAETIGFDIYGQRGAGGLTLRGDAGKAARKKLDARIARMEKTYTQKVQSFQQYCADHGLDLRSYSEHVTRTIKDKETLLHELDGGGGFSKVGGHKSDDVVTAKPQPAVMRTELSTPPRSIFPGLHHALRLEYEENENKRKKSAGSIFTPCARVMVDYHPVYDFETVVSVDLHDIRWDIDSDTVVGDEKADTFARLARMRRYYLEQAKKWLDDTAQAYDSYIDTSENDIEEMELVAADVHDNGVLHAAGHAGDPLDVARTVLRKRRQARLQQRYETYKQHDAHVGVSQTHSGFVTADSSVLPLLHKQIEQVTLNEAKKIRNEGLH